MKKKSVDKNFKIIPDCFYSKIILPLSRIQKFLRGHHVPSFIVVQHV